MSKLFLYSKRTRHVLLCILMGCIGISESAARKTATAAPPRVPVTIEFFAQPVKQEGNRCHIDVHMGFNWIGDSVMYISKARLSFEFQGQGISILDIKNSALAGGAPADNAFCEDKGYFTVRGNTLTICFDQAAQRTPVALYKTSTAAVRDIGITLRMSEGGCLTRVLMTGAEIRQAGSEICVPSVSTAGLHLPVCPPYISGSIKTQTGQAVREVTVLTTDEKDCERTIATDSLGDYSLCPCGSGAYTLTPARRDHVLQGITTLDLAIISKHILHITLLDSPYKLIAADANKSGTVTTLDIVALRRLILGIDDELGNNNSWRFVSKNYVFPDPQNPFSTMCPEVLSDTITNANPHISGADFVGIKTGDVSGTAQPRTMSDLQAFEVPARAVKRGELFTLPLRFAGNAPLTALQTALRFDPSLMEFIGPAAGDVEGILPDCFGLTDVQQGIVRLVWLARDPVEAPLQAGQLLCQLTFRAKKTIPASAIPLRLDENDRLKPEGYTLSAEAVYPLAVQRDAVERRSALGPAPGSWVSIECRTNPATSAATLFVEAKRPVAQGRLFILDGFGRRMAYRELYIAEGPSQVPLEEAPAWPAGLYHWVFLSGSERLSEGSFLKAD